MPRLQVCESGGRYFWRLLSVNNRTIAVSCADFADEEACVGEARRIFALAVTAPPEPRQRGLDRWTWVLVDESGVEVASSYTVYPRRAECRDAIRRFNAAVSGQAGR